MKYRLVKEVGPSGCVTYYTEKLWWCIPIWVYVSDSLYFNPDDALNFYKNLKFTKPRKIILDKCCV